MKKNTEHKLIQQYAELKIQLEAKARELKIESGLEKVRAVALKMKEPADMLKICKTISLQLQSLGVKEIRNIQTAIFYEQRGTYMNYQYYAKHDKTFITDTIYTDHKVARDFAAQMLKGKGKFYITHIKGRKKLKDWIAYQKKTKVFIDKYLNTASSLNYYWYSLGPVALGISTYQPLTKEEENLFKQFLNVFELAYRRYLDIEKAEAQAREAKIEASLEKVRAQAMGMMKPDDLLNVCETLFKELSSLGFDELRNAIINIHSDTDSSFINYDYADTVGKSVNRFTNNILPFVGKIIKTSHSTDNAFIESHLTGKALAEFKRLRKQTSQKDDPRLNKAKGLYFYFYSIGIGSIGISTFSKISEERVALLKRFRNVFAFAYRRYMDVAKAEAQAREAKIEASLEKVRAQALGMKKPDELLGICKILYTELQTLGFDELRNAMINIHDDDKGSFLNYDFSDSAGATVTTIFYNSHPATENLVKKVRKANDAFAEFVIKGSELNKWREYRKGMGEKDDPRLDKVSALSYYFYSIGTGSIGISTYTPASEEKIKLLKRFRNVFAFAYRRYMDVAQAEKQAIEARIEASLERMRAVAMSLHKSEELITVCESMYKELKLLGFSNIRNAQIAIKNDAKESYSISVYSDYESVVMGEAPYKSSPIVEELYNELGNSGDTFYQKDFSGKKFNDWRKWRESLSPLKDSREATADSLCFYMYSIGTGHLGISSFNAITNEQVEILKRFKNVFVLSYQRYTDVAQAEAQAREAQIELALERVRARTMAMQKSDELSEAVYILFNQFKELGEKPDQATIGIINEKEWVIEYWVTMYGNQNERVFKFSMDEPNVTNRIYKAWKDNYKSLVIDLSGKELHDFTTYRASKGGAAYNPEEKHRIINVAFFSKGLLNVQSNESRSSESIKLLERFAAVFEQTYTRFLDLQKAEAQARESQIQLALERVRARTMAMHQSNELAETALLLFQQLQHLGLSFSRTGFYIWKKDADLVEGWTSNGALDEILPPLLLPFKEDEGHRGIYEASLKGEPIYEQVLGGEELKRHYQWLMSQPSAPNTLKKLNESEYVLLETQYKYAAIFKDGYLLLIAGTAQPDASGLLNRFAKVFEQTYTRFLDLQKAEAQAREAQIEAALERVRSRSMGMQKSEELKEVIQVVYDQFVHLNIHIEHTGFLIDYKERDDMHIWLADQHLVPSEVTIPWFDSPPNNSIKEAKEKGQDFFKYHLTFEEKNKFYRDLFKFIPGVPEETLEYYFNCPGLAGSGVLLENIGLYIENFSGISLYR